MADFPFNNDASQAQRRKVLENDRKVSTYFQRAQADADLELGGRYAKVTETTVTGATPGPIYPKQPPNSPWHHDPMPPEPPLGFSVNDLEPVGEPHERQAPAGDAASVASDDAAGGSAAAIEPKPHGRCCCRFQTA
jgi:hypothetical protein